MPSNDFDIAVEYFRALRAEIDLRINNHAHYVISKIGVTGALLGYLTTANAPNLAVVPLVAVLLDFAILHNVATINAIGQYIRDQLEKRVFSKHKPDLALWETTGGQTKVAATRDLMDRGAQWLISVAFFGAAWTLQPKSSNPQSWVWYLLGGFLLVDLALHWRLRAYR